MQYYSPYTVWNYRYNVVDAQNIAAGIGIQHIAEAPAIFGVDSNINGSWASYKTYNSNMVPVMMDYWLSFIRSLDPNTFKSLLAPVWQPYQGNLRVVFQTNNSQMETVPTSQRHRCDFWGQLAAKMEQ